MLHVKTPKGEFQWVTINGSGKLDLNGKPKFTVDIILEADAAQPLIDEIDALWDEEKPKGAKEPKSTGYKVLEDGKIKFTFKTDTTYPKSGDAKVITVYNAKAQRINFTKMIGNGSEGRVVGMAAVYDAGVAARGVTLYLDAIQLTKFIEYQGRDAGFEADEDEDGYTGEDENDGLLPDDE